MKYSVKLFIIALLTLITISVKADPQIITIKDWTGHDFAPDLVDYTIPSPADGGNDFHALENQRVFIERLLLNEVIFGRIQL